MNANAFLTSWMQGDYETLKAHLHEDVACFGLGEGAMKKVATLRLLMAYNVECVEQVDAYLSYFVATVKIYKKAMVLKLRFAGDQLRGLYAMPLPKTRRLRIDFSYDGSLYAGFQRQKRQKTVQGTLESALAGLFNETVFLHAASRTDAGVHARHQVAHFDIDNPLKVDQIKRLLNGMLPRDIRVASCQEVPPVFHARYDVCMKTYQYTLVHEDDAFLAHYAHQTPLFDLTRLQRILKQFEGTHNFRNLAKADATDTVRTIHAVKAWREEDKTFITFEASGFLRHMVRMMVARALEDVMNNTNMVETVLKYPNQDVPKPLAPSSGLTLMRIIY